MAKALKAPPRESSHRRLGVLPDGRAFKEFPECSSGGVRTEKRVSQRFSEKVAGPYALRPPRSEKPTGAIDKIIAEAAKELLIVLQFFFYRRFVADGCCPDEVANARMLECLFAAGRPPAQNRKFQKELKRPLGIALRLCVELLSARFWRLARCHS